MFPPRDFLPSLLDRQRCNAQFAPGELSAVTIEVTAGKKQSGRLPRPARHFVVMPLVRAKFYLFSSYIVEEINNYFFSNI